MMRKAVVGSLVLMQVTCLALASRSLAQDDVNPGCREVQPGVFAATCDHDWQCPGVGSLDCSAGYCDCNGGYCPCPSRGCLNLRDLVPSEPNMLVATCANAGDCVAVGGIDCSGALCLCPDDGSDYSFCSCGQAVPAPVPAPTTSRWGLIVLVGLLSVVAASGLRRSRRVRALTVLLATTVAWLGTHLT